MSTTLVKNGTIVTASDRYDADIYIDKGVDHPHRPGPEPARRHRGRRLGQARDARAASTCTRTSTCPSAAPPRPTTSRPARSPRPTAAPRPLVDFAIQDFGEGLYPAFEGWMERAEGKAVIDYAFHMIVRELTDQVSGDMDRMVRHDGITSFKLFMAYPGVFMVDDATIFRALLQDPRERRARLHARRERRRHRHAGEGGAAQGPDRAEVPRADAADARRGRGHRPRHRAGRDGGRADLHRPPLLRRRPREGEAGARHGPAGLRRDLPAVPVPLLRGLRARRASRARST